MPNPKIRRDDDGLYIVTNGGKYRPGAVAGRAHAIRMDDGGLQEGGNVQARMVEQTELTRLKLPDGTVTYWHVEGPTRIRGLMDAPADAVWKPDGRRDFSHVVIG
jgi:hypothetical protein